MEMQSMRRRETLSGRLIRTISERIAAGHYRVGDRLPSEQEMIEEFGVSRTVVREAIDALYPLSGSPMLYVHPDDAELIRTHLGEALEHKNWRIVEDHSLSPGGCRIEHGGSEVDASKETRWRRVIESIGISQEWLSDKP